MRSAGGGQPGKGAYGPKNGLHCWDGVLLATDRYLPKVRNRVGALTTRVRQTGLPPMSNSKPLRPPIGMVKNATNWVRGDIPADFSMALPAVLRCRPPPALRLPGREICWQRGRGGWGGWEAHLKSSIRPARRFRAHSV